MKRTFSDISPVYTKSQWFSLHHINASIISDQLGLQTISDLRVLFKILENISPFCAATDIPVWEFW